MSDSHLLKSGSIEYYSFPLETEDLRGKSNKFLHLFKEYNFVRIGTLGDGACLIHSILTAINGNNYINLSIREKQEQVKQIRIIISDSISFKKFMEMKIEGKPLWRDKSYCKELWRNDYKVSPEEAYSAYVAHIKKYSSWLGSECLQLLCDHFSADIFILNESEGLVFQTLEMKDYIKKRDSITILHKNGHYEPIGIKCDNPKHQPVFVFKTDYEFIRELRKRYRCLRKRYLNLLEPSNKK